MEIDLPVGYRFCPTDEELITFFLGRRVLNQSLPFNNFKEIELYEHTPEQLEGLYGARRENEMYFITKRKLNSATATRACRTVANAGFWRASTKRLSVKDFNGDVIGYKMLLNYFLSKGNVTSWLMYEYTTLTGSQNMDELVLCKVYNKKNEQKYKISAQEEEPRQNMKTQEPATYQIDGIVLHEQNVAPQAAQPAYEVADQVGLLNQSLQPSANELVAAVESNVFDYQPLMVQAPTYQCNDFSLTDEPINVAIPYNQQYLMPQAHDIPIDVDLEFAKDLEEQPQQPSRDNIPTHEDLQSAQDMEAQLQEPAGDIPTLHLHGSMEAQLQQWVAFLQGP